MIVPHLLLSSFFALLPSCLCLSFFSLSFPWCRSLWKKEAEKERKIHNEKRSGRISFFLPLSFSLPYNISLAPTFPSINLGSVKPFWAIFCREESETDWKIVIVRSIVLLIGPGIHPSDVFSLAGEWIGPLRNRKKEIKGKILNKKTKRKGHEGYIPPLRAKALISSLKDFSISFSRGKGKSREGTIAWEREREG